MKRTILLLGIIVLGLLMWASPMEQARAQSENATEVILYYGDNLSISVNMTVGFTGIDTVVNNAVNNYVAGQTTMFTGIVASIIKLFLLAMIVLLAFWHRDKILYILACFMCLLYGFDYWTTSQTFSIALVIAGIVIFIKAVTQKGAE